MVKEAGRKGEMVKEAGRKGEMVEEEEGGRGRRKWKVVKTMYWDGWLRDMKRLKGHKEAWAFKWW